MVKQQKDDAIRVAINLGLTIAEDEGKAGDDEKDEDEGNDGHASWDVHGPSYTFMGWDRMSGSLLPCSYGLGLPAFLTWCVFSYYVG